MESEKKNKFSHTIGAIIKISSFYENPHRAVASVIRNSSCFSELHFVCRGWSEFNNQEQDLYDGWAEQKKQLADEKIKVVIHPELNPNNINATVCLELSPYMQLTGGGLLTIMNQIEKSVFENDALTHFGVESIMVIRHSQQEMKQNPLQILDAFTSYGFILAMFVFDYIRRYWINFGSSLYTYWGKKYALHTDLTAHLVYRTYGKHTLAPQHTWWTLYNRNTHPIEYGGEGVVIAPEDNNRGWKFVFWFLSNHKHVSFGWLNFWVLGFLAYYWCFSYPWWNSFITIHSPRWLQLLYRPDTTQVWMAWIVAQTLYCITITQRYLEFPFQWLICLFHPIYVALLPLVILYAKFYKSRAGWKIK